MKETLEAEAVRDRDAEKDDVGYDTMYAPDTSVPGAARSRGSMNASMRQDDTEGPEFNASIRDADYGMEAGENNKDPSERMMEEEDDEANPAIPHGGSGIAGSRLDSKSES